MALFDSPIFVEGVLPFLLVFVLVFAILQKTKLLGGDEAKQINSLVSLAIALILVATPLPRSYIVQMMPWLAVAVVILLIFGIVYGFMFTPTDDKKALEFPPWVKQTVLWLGIVFVVLLVLNITGQMARVTDLLGDENILSNLVIVGVVVLALWVVLRNPTNGSS